MSFKHVPQKRESERLARCIDLSNSPVVWKLPNKSAPGGAAPQPDCETTHGRCSSLEVIMQMESQRQLLDRPKNSPHIAGERSTREQASRRHRVLRCAARLDTDCPRETPRGGVTPCAPCPGHLHPVHIHRILGWISNRGKKRLPCRPPPSPDIEITTSITDAWYL